MKCIKKHTIKALIFLNILILISFALLPSISNAQTDLSLILKEKRTNFSIPVGYTEYIVYVKTADIADAGTDSSVYLTINGDGQKGTTIDNLVFSGSTGEFDLTGKSFQETDREWLTETRQGISVTHGSTRVGKPAALNYFERNSHHRFNVIAKNVGSVTSVNVRKDNFGAAPAWKLEYVDIAVRGKLLRFNVDKWFSSDSNTQTFTNSFSKVETYEVKTYTGNVSGAGTDANIFLTIEGIDEKGKVAALPEIRLNVLASGDLFERHTIDILKAESRQYLSQIKRITIRSDNKYPGSAWYLGWVMINGVAFQVDDWIESGKLTKVVVNPKFVAPTTVARTAPQPTNTTSTNVQQRPAKLTSIPPEFQVTPGLTCNLEDWVGTWNTTQGQIEVKPEDGHLRVTFGNSLRNLRGIPAAGNPCVFIGESIPTGQNRRTFQSHGFAMKKMGSFVGLVRSRIDTWTGATKWNGQKQTVSTASPNSNSNGTTNPTKSLCTPADWEGNWKTNLFPEMSIKIEPSGISGIFQPANFPFKASFLRNNLCVIRGTWMDSDGVTTGAFRFVMNSKGNFAGAYVGREDLNQDLSSKPLTWRGSRIEATQNSSTVSNQPTQPKPTITATAVNVALGKVARQSSTGFGGVASRAVDGITDGNWANNSVTHTTGVSGDWWEVDLGAMYEISQIKIHNRTDCCSDRLKQFGISVSQQPFTSNKSGFQFAPLQGYKTDNPWVFEGKVPARYVRIFLNGAGVLSLAEVEVVGTPLN